MKRTASSLIFLLMVVRPVYADNRDSTGQVPAPTSVFKATTRLHSMGLFSYAGRLVSHNHVVDLNITYSRRTWGIQVFKAVDLNDRHNPINFAFATVNRPFHIGSNLTITPHAGIVLEQSNSFADHSSDAAMLTTAWRLTPHVTLEHTALVASIVTEQTEGDWINRLRLLYSKGHVDVTLFAWHNNGVFDRNDYATFGVSLFMSRLPLVGKLKMQSGITALYMASASEEKTMVGANGLFLTIGIGIN